MSPQVKVTVTQRKAWALQLILVAEGLEINMLFRESTHEYWKYSSSITHHLILILTQPVSRLQCIAEKETLSTKKNFETCIILQIRTRASFAISSTLQFSLE